MRRGFVALALLCALPGTAHAAPAITTLSTRADLVSGGDVLVRVTPKRARVQVNGRDVTRAFAVRPDGRYLGLVQGLKTGRSVLTATAGGRTAALTVTNHSSAGPVLSGPQIQPWPCLAGALDAQCARKPAFSFTYRSTAGGGLRAYDPANPPADVATTVVAGRRVPFIVRQEVGTIDRDEYRVAALYDPAKPYTAAAPQAGNAHKLLITHGFSCDTGYGQSTAPPVLDETALARGFVVMSNALDNAGHNCNLLTQAEALVMTKEHVIDTYGTVRWTIGTGCSGGSLVQQQVANAYPGIYQGITPQCSFPDTWSSANQYVDYEGLRRYFETPSRQAAGTDWTPAKVAAVEGHITPANAVNFTTAIPPSGDPSRPCPGVPAADVFDPQTNPKGVRCSLQDYTANLFGRDPKTGWALRPADDVGVQYGLRALRNGTISAAEFADLNAKLGGRDVEDYRPTAARTAGDPAAIRRVYRSGAVNQADHLDRVAIIDLRGPDNGTFHDVIRTYTVRARLKREHGTAANQVLWRGQKDLVGDPAFTDEAILAMDRWLAAVHRDHRRLPLPRKIIRDRPASVHARCTDAAGQDVGPALCDKTVLAYSTPRQVAGEGPADDTEKCALEPLRRSDYGSTSFTDAQWASLQATFPTGVCDWSKPGLHRVPTTAWQTYQRANGTVIYGGRALGPRPRSAIVPRVSVSIRRACATGTVRVRVEGVGVKRLTVTAGTLGGSAPGPALTLAKVGRKAVRVTAAVTLAGGKRARVARRLPACASA